jgi:osmotically inducible protein OsmC
MENQSAGWTLSRIQLEVHAKVPDASQALFMEAAMAAKSNCPIARLLKANISMIASLEV